MLVRLQAWHKNSAEHVATAVFLQACELQFMCRGEYSAERMALAVLGAQLEIYDWIIPVLCAGASTARSAWPWRCWARG